MIKNTHIQTGSAQVVIIALLVVSLIGALGFIFWQNYLEKNTQTSSLNKAGTSNDQQSKNSQSERYVTLEDWGVKFKIDNNLKDTMIGQSNSGPSDSYLLFSERVEQAFKKACPSYPGSNSGAGWNVVRLTERPAVNSEGQLADMEGELINDSAINGYFYVAHKTGTMCPGDYSPVVGEDSDYSEDSDAVLSSLRTLQPIE